MIKALIVDDEVKAGEVLYRLIKSYCSDVNVVDVVDSIPSAVEAIKHHNPSLIFLDVEMPGTSGFRLFDHLDEKKHKVVFTTAYSQYAVKAIRYSAVDYLLKPIDIEELQQAVAKVKRLLESQMAPAGSNAEKGTGSGPVRKKLKELGVPVKDGISYIKADEIIRIEAEGNYSKIIITTGPELMASRTLKEFEETLDSTLFFRAHNSHLINLTFVKKFVRGEGYFAEMTDGSKVEISRRKKDEFLEIMRKKAEE